MDIALSVSKWQLQVRSRNALHVPGDCWRVQAQEVARPGSGRNCREMAPIDNSFFPASFYYNEIRCWVVGRMGRIPILVATFLLLISLAPAQNNSDPANSPNPEKLQPAAKVYHDGSIRDMDAVGNRNVGCARGIGNWYSLEQQMAMGRSYAQQVESSSKMIADPMITEYVNRIGQNLVRNSDAQVPFTIKIIDTDDINAFALPGGYFYVDSGLILAADSEAELAGVMAHEIAHVAGCHAAREMSRSQLMNFGVNSADFRRRRHRLRHPECRRTCHANGISEVYPQLRIRGRLPGHSIYVQSGIRSASPDRILRKSQSNGEAQTGESRQSV